MKEFDSFSEGGERMRSDFLGGSRKRKHGTQLRWRGNRQPSEELESRPVLELSRLFVVGLDPSGMNLVVPPMNAQVAFLESLLDSRMGLQVRHLLDHIHLAQSLQASCLTKPVATLLEPLHGGLRILQPSGCCWKVV